MPNQSISRFLITQCFLLALLLVTSATAFSQADSSVVRVSADPRVAWLSAKQSQINKLSAFKNSAGQYKGFRVMVLNTNNRDLAYQTRADILRYFPDKAVYMSYQSPYFKLKAGDFIKREDAEKFKKELSKFFTSSLFVISDIVKITPEDEIHLLQENEDK